MTKKLILSDDKIAIQNGATITIYAPINIIVGLDNDDAIDNLEESGYFNEYSVVPIREQTNSLRLYADEFKKLITWEEITDVLGVSSSEPEVTIDWISAK